MDEVITLGSAALMFLAVVGPMVWGLLV